MWSLFEKGGFMMYPLGLASIFAVALILERAVFFWRNRMPARLVLDLVRAELDRLPGRDGIASAKRAIEKIETPASRLARFALSKQEELSGDDLSAQMEIALSREMPALEQRLTALNTLGSTAPLLGLAGTVVGMIKAFSVMARGDVASASLAGGISEALLTTASGLFVAIPCVFAYTIYARRVDVMATELETFTTELVALLAGRRRRF